jgi:hypothetical protein
MIQKLIVGSYDTMEQSHRSAHIYHFQGGGSEVFFTSHPTDFLIKFLQKMLGHESNNLLIEKFNSSDSSLHLIS